MGRWGIYRAAHDVTPGPLSQLKRCWEAGKKLHSQLTSKLAAPLTCLPGTEIGTQLPIWHTRGPLAVSFHVAAFHAGPFSKCTKILSLERAWPRGRRPAAMSCCLALSESLFELFKNGHEVRSPSVCLCHLPRDWCLPTPTRSSS